MNDEKPKSIAHRNIPTWLLLPLLIVIFGIPIYLMQKGGGSTPRTTTASAGASCSGSCRVRASDVTSIPVTTTRGAWADAAADPSGKVLTALIVRGEAFFIEQGTQVSTQGSFTSGLTGIREVLILDGAMIGRRGYTRADWIVK